MRKIAILITIDCLREDRLNCFGYGVRETSPFIDSLAKESKVFSNFYANGVPTFASFPTIMTGQPIWSDFSDFEIPKKAKSIAQLFREKGYYTVGVNAANPHISAYKGFDKGFDVFHDFLSKESRSSLAEKIYYKIRERAFIQHPSPGARVVVDKTIKAVRRAKGKDKVFLWIHFMDVHGPYFNGAKVKPENLFDLRRIKKGLFIKWILKEKIDRPEDVELINRLYDNSIKYVDKHVKRLMGKLKGRFGFDEIKAIFTADHGENLMERGYFHHNANRLNQQLIKIPFFVYGGGRGFVKENRSFENMPEILSEEFLGEKGKDVGQEVVITVGLKKLIDPINRPVDYYNFPIILSGIFKNYKMVFDEEFNGYKYYLVDGYKEKEIDSETFPAEERQKIADKVQHARNSLRKRLNLLGMIGSDGLI